MRKAIIVILVAAVAVVGINFSLNAHHHSQNYERVNVHREEIEDGIQLTITSDDAAVVKNLREAGSVNCPYLDSGENNGLHHGRNLKPERDCHGSGIGHNGNHNQNRGHMMH